jgi:hypothetical protein
MRPTRVKSSYQKGVFIPRAVFTGYAIAGGIADHLLFAADGSPGAYGQDGNVPPRIDNREKKMLC